MSKNTIENKTGAKPLDEMSSIGSAISEIRAGLSVDRVVPLVKRLGKTEMTHMQISFVIGDIMAYYIKPKQIDKLPKSERKTAVDTNLAICEILRNMIISQDLGPSHTTKILELGNSELNVEIVKNTWSTLSKVQRRNLEKRANPEMLDAIRKNHTEGSPL